VNSEKFLKAMNDNPGAVVGLSALLTTTMENMKKTVEVIRGNYTGSTILIGGAPVTMDYCQKINADFYSPDPQGAVKFLNQIV
jgi:5-methyltetrahydrofolate--homocysteine methyltransferase